MIFQSKIYVRYKPGISDPESINILSALDKLGFENAKSLSTGKFFELEIESKDLKSAKNEILIETFIFFVSNGYSTIQILRNQNVSK